MKIKNKIFTFIKQKPTEIQLCGCGRPLFNKRVCFDKCSDCMAMIEVILKREYAEFEKKKVGENPHCKLGANGA